MKHSEFTAGDPCPGNLIESGQGKASSPDGIVRTRQFYRCDVCHEILSGEATEAVDPTRLIADLARSFRVPRK